MVEKNATAIKPAKSSEDRTREFNDVPAQQVVECTSELENLTEQQGQEIDELKKTELELRESIKREKLTKNLIQLMSRSFDANIILEIAVREIGTFFNVDECLVIYHENPFDKTGTVRFSSQYYHSAMAQPLMGNELPVELLTLVEIQAEKDIPVIRLNLSESVHLPIAIRGYLEKYGIQSALSLEIKYRDIAFGSLVLFQFDYLRAWTEQEVEFLEILAAHAGSALYQARLFQQETQAKQEAEEANRQKSKILSYVSHDFKNPLASMKRFIELLERDKADPLSEKHREFIGYIAESASLLNNMVLAILDKARLEDGKIIPVPQWLEISSLLNDLKPLFNSMASQQKIELCIEQGPGLTALKADPVHIRQILINLISNAVKYNRKNGKIFLRFYKSKDKQFAVIEVQDTGLGIPKEKLSHLFTDYFRTNLAQVSLIEGTGLGLAFIKKLIELHGGSITVNSEIGVGSTFIAKLPLA